MVNGVFMIKSYVFLAVFLVFGLIGMVRGLDFIAGDNDFMHINVKNQGAEDLDDLSVSVLIYDLGILFRTGNFDLDDRDNTGKAIFWEVPADIEPGQYWARITVSNDDEREVKHRLVTIV